MSAQFTCENQLRLAMVRDARDANNKPFLNGIDFLEIGTNQTTLLVNFIHPLPGQVGGFPEPPAPKLSAANFAITGGVRVTGIRVTNVSSAGSVATLTVSSPGDFSNYVLKFVGSAGDPAPPAGFDTQLAEVEFNFKIDCPSDFDCQPEAEAPPPPPPEPELDYLAKDYASFRQLMLDRLATILPEWKERNPADLGVAVVEALAYAGDQLSYYQDAVASEAYLDTARRRVSVRRHARLLDYRMHEGVNARVWVQINVTQDDVDLPAGTALFTRQPGLPLLIKPPGPAGSPDYDRLVASGQEGFETLHAARLYVDHKEMRFYTWGNSECCLPAGATRATLKGAYTHLKPGDVLILEETHGPQSGLTADADPAHRQAVRLVRVDQASDPLGGQFENPPTLAATQLTEIEWLLEDALRFPLCISSRQGTQVLSDLSVARGNIVLADHGRSVKGQALVPPPAPSGSALKSRSLGYRPMLTRQSLVHRNTYKHSHALKRPAAEALVQDPPAALPAVTLQSGPETWVSRRDLLNSDRFATEFVVERESDGESRLRFGDNIHGRVPPGGSPLVPTFRVGGGAAGNLGADALYHIISQDTRLESVRNPLPASGGTGAEPLESVRLYAPQAFYTQERAVTEEDYAAIAERHPAVQKAVATLRWTGSWKTVFITVDRMGGLGVDQQFKDELHQFMEIYRMAAHDVAIDAPRYVPLEIELRVCVLPGYTRAEVKQALLEAFSNKQFSDGRLGFFHPDQFTFGQTLYLSPVVSTAMQAPGVEWVEVQTFKRWGKPAQNEIPDGKIRFGRLEIARLDNDPSAPENGLFELNMEGGL